jgi:hypothetical protein
LFEPAELGFVDSFGHVAGGGKGLVEDVARLVG